MDVINSPLESTSDIWLELGVQKTGASLVTVVLVVKKRPANAGGLRDEGSIPGPGRFPEGGHGNRLQYSQEFHGKRSLVQNPPDRGAWWATVHGVAKESDTT